MIPCTTRTPTRRAARAAIPIVLAAGLLAGALAGCTESETPQAAASPPASPTVQAPESIPKDGPLDPQQACAVMYESGDEPLERRIGDALVDASKEFDVSTADAMHALSVELRSLQPRLPKEFGEALATVRVPFSQMQEHLDSASGESVELDIASAIDGLKEYRALCS